MKYMLFMLSMLFMFLKHPLSFGATILIQTIIISIITGKLNYNFWFSYILFLIMIGGMLILFIYMTSIASNKKFKMSYKLLNLSLFMLIISTLMMFFDDYYKNIDINIQDLMNQNKQMYYSLSMNKFMNWPNNMITYMMIIYLLITLIATVKMTKFKKGPLRLKN